MGFYSLVALHLALLWQQDDVSLFALSILFWWAVHTLLESRSPEKTLVIAPKAIANFLGLMLLTLILVRVSVRPNNNVLAVYPLGVGCGLALLAAGWRGLRVYLPELTILFFLGVPKVVLWPLIDISKLTASFATYFLWRGGLPVQQFGTEIAIADVGRVDVNMGCSGLEGIFYLVGLGVLFLITFPLERKFQGGWVLAIAVVLGFLINVGRVMVMALLSGDFEALDYWHVGDGSLLFSLLSVILFGGVYWWFLQWDQRYLAQMGQNPGAGSEEDPPWDDFSLASLAESGTELGWQDGEDW